MKRRPKQLKVNIDGILKQDHEIIIRGWAFDQQSLEFPDISFSLKDKDRNKILHTKITLSDRQDVRLVYPGTNKIGFIIQVEVKRLSGKLLVTFKSGKSKQTIPIYLGKKYVSKYDFSSPYYTANRLKNYIWPYIRSGNVKALYNKLRNRVPSLNHPYVTWVQNTESHMDDQKILKDALKFDYQPKISILVPVYNVEPIWFSKMIESVLKQSYSNWELCIADDHSTNPKLIEMMHEYEKKDPRIKIVYRAENGHISRATNSALEIAEGEFVALLDNDDELHRHALYEVVKVLNENPSLDMIYSDEDKIDLQGNRLYPHFKSDYAPDTLMSNNYICHFSVFRKSIAEEIEGFTPGLEGVQDYDFILRFVEKTNQIKHIPKILYHWRMIPNSTAAVQSAKNYAYDNGIKALNNALQRRKLKGEVISGKALGIYEVHYEVIGEPSISIIIPTKNNAQDLKTCIDSILSKTSWKNYEIIIADNGSTEEKTIDLIQYYKDNYPNKIRSRYIDMPFNYSKINNMAVKESKGDYLIFLNDDTEIITPNWMEFMLGYAQQPWIGAVGAKLFYPDWTIQHAGVVLGLAGSAGHVHYSFPKEDCGYFGKLIGTTNFSAVTGACLMIGRELFEQIGGFDENMPIAFNDVDLCLKCVDKGLYNIYLPFVEVMHYESRSRGQDKYDNEKLERLEREKEKLRSKWPEFILNDPMYNYNLTREGIDFTVDPKRFLS